MNQAERVKIIREHFKYTQKEFGAKIDVGQTYLSQIEKGDRPLTEKLIKLICYEFDVNYAWLKYGEGEVFSKAKKALVDQLAYEYKLSDEKNPKKRIRAIHMNSINERIKFLRKEELQLTQIDFGKRLGVAGSTVVGWEKGDRTPSESTIKFICREFDVNYAWLKYGEGDMFISIEKTILDQLANEYKLDDKRKELIERILSFSGDEIKTFEKMGFLILKL